MSNFVKTKSYNHGGIVMKTLFKFFAVIMLFAITGCSSAYKTTTDDIYFIPQTVRGGESTQLSQPEGGKTVEVVEVVNETAAYSQPANVSYVEHETAHYDDTAFYYSGNGSLSETEYQYDADGNIVINNYYYGDYYDFAYASRIRRFHRPYASFGYYDPFFTNMYFYMPHPHFYGVSIYMGYGAMPFYYPGYFAFSPWYSHWYWNPFFWRRSFHPFHPFGYWGSSYWAGYHAGYFAGLHNPWGYGYWGYYNYHYNSYDGSNYHYGPRGSMGSTVDRSSTGRYTGGTDSKDSFADRFEAQTRINDAGRREIITSVADQSMADAQQTTSRETAAAPERRPAEVQVQERAQALAAQQQSREAYQPASRIENYQAPARERYERTTSPRYTRPEQASPERQPADRGSNYTMPRTYTSPSHQQPSSPQMTRPAPATVRPPADSRPTRDQAAPQQRPQQQPTQRPAAHPTRTDRGQPSYTPPPSREPSRTTTSPARSTPQRSTTSPTRSTPTRSTASPARSTPSRSTASPARSTPSRSSGTSSRSSSSSSRSSGGRNR